ncbi:ComEC/Rec2 family competence protein [Microvirga sp. STR05]|uniref:ComEC/Rec2 family competence protein n=1 Tax=Hymenobacter duratus TaxID=2771356 RepID=A0ABR8JEZ6_9BACT|nr:ComEC/Rec2 family competence protein [Hymenobacter duratus]MBD2715440.1 ComEC/Rec2 family competence protein [Hymenobacter duratus]MBR7950348.1 ComEC/Rec2 family competence protein [Microvirga sp. STR05]
MIHWASYAFVRLTLALVAGILTFLYFGEQLPDLRWPLAGLAVLFFVVQVAVRRSSNPASADNAGLVALLAVYVTGVALTQQATESRDGAHLYRFGSRIEYYRAVVDDYTVVRPATYATTVRVSAVRVGGQWRPALGGIRVSIPRDSGVAAPQYGDVWLVRGAPAPSKAPLNPGEFDYRRYLQYHQVYHQQFIHPDQYRKVATEPPSYLKAAAMRAARVLDGVFRQYVRAKREYALASALVLGIKDDIDQQTKQAYANTGTTHIMAVSGLQVGLLFGAVTWLLGLLPGRRGPLFRFVTAALGLAVIWSYAFLTGLSASVLRAAVMFTFIIVARATQRQTNMFNTLAVAAFCLLCYDPYLLCDVGFQLSFLAVISIVYLQPRIVAWFDVKDYFLQKQRPWQTKTVQKFWKWSGKFLDGVWQATALSLAAQVATFPLGLFYFHQFPLSFLFSNLVAVPISSGAVYVGLGLLVLKGLVAVVGLASAGAAQVLDILPQLVARVFEWMIWLFNEYIFWIGRAMPGALISGIHVTAPQAWLICGVILALLAFFRLRNLAWMGLACALLGLFAGSRVWAAHELAPDERLVIYSIPRRSVVGFWQGAAAHVVSADSLPLNETERTYRIVPGTIQRDARQVVYHAGWRGAPVPATADTAARTNLVLAVWRGVRVALVAGRLAGARESVPVDVVVLRRNARVWPEDLAATFGYTPTIVFDSSCKSWYVTSMQEKLQQAGWQTHDVTLQGAFVRPIQAEKK